MEYAVSKIMLDKELHGSVGPHHLRGALAGMNIEDPLFHQHGKESGPIYRYPKIQYKILGGQPVVVGIDQGARPVAGLDILGRCLVLGRQSYQVLETRTSFSDICPGIQQKPAAYEFASPWLALNQHNYQKFVMAGAGAARRKMLEKILVGNLLSLSKGLGITVAERISVSSMRLAEVQMELKSTPMIAFLGSFRVNFFIPGYLGIGKSVSRGFGAVSQVAQ